jgi:phosphopantetheine adenylyltransferase
MNPVVIIEVLSDSTRNYDQGEKFSFYRSLESLQEYVLVDQDKSVVMVLLPKPVGCPTDSAPKRCVIVSHHTAPHQQTLELPALTCLFFPLSFGIFSSFLMVTVAVK